MNCSLPHADHIESTGGWTLGAMLVLAENEGKYGISDQRTDEEVGMSVPETAKPFHRLPA